MLAKQGYDVIGVDLNKKVVDQLNKGKIQFEEPGLIELFRKVKKKFKVETNLQSSDTYIIAVPTPLDKEIKMADLSAVKNASKSISKVLKEGQTVVLESTVPPGTSEKFVIPILLKSGIKSFNYIHCPERAMPGKTISEMVNNDRIIGGKDKRSIKKAKELYSTFVKGNLFTTDLKTAEFVKLIENTYRDINIALVNEFSLMAEEIGINIWEAIELANKHPRANILKPGPGVGGHCIAIDPLFLAEKSNQSRIIKLAREINDFMPIYVVKLIIEMLDSIEKPMITILGIAYRGNIGDIRESPSLKIKKLAENEGIEVKVYDPFVKDYPEKYSNLEDATKDSDCLVLITDHDIFKKINPNKLKVRSKNILDARNILDHKKWIKNGFKVKLLGDGHK